MLHSVTLCYVFVVIFEPTFGLYECPEKENLMESDEGALRFPYYTIKKDGGGKKYFGYKDAVEICRQCFDADLISDMKSLKLRSYKLFFGVFRNPGSAEWKWSNHLKVESWKDYVSNFIQDNVTIDGSYGVVAEPDVWTAIPNIPVEQDCKKNQDLYGEIEKIVCQRPYHKECRTWNYTEPQCLYENPFGCYKVVVTRKRNGDDAGSHGCTNPLVTYTAYQCASQECRCELTDWSEWSACTARDCYGGQRKQMRNIATPNCYFANRYNLVKKENCTILGCNKLSNANENEL